MNNSERKILLNLEQIIGGLSALALVVAVFLPWGSTENASILGISGKDSLLVIGMSIIALIFLLVPKIPTWIALVMGILSLGIGIYDFGKMAELTATLSGSVGSGLYLTIIGSIGVVIGAIMDMVRNSR